MATKKTIRKGKSAVKKPVSKPKTTMKKTTMKTKPKTKPVASKAKVIKKPAVKKAQAVKPAKKVAVKKPSAPTASIRSNAPQPELQTVTNRPAPSLQTAARTRGGPSVSGPLDFTPYSIGKTEDYMNLEQRNHFRKILEMWKEQLMKEVDTTVVHMKEEAIVYPDPLDRAAQEEGFNLELRTRDRERKLIKKIEQALDKLDHEEYGYCEDCGAEIGIRRLEARPTADKCIDCKTFEEIREKQVGTV